MAMNTKEKPGDLPYYIIADIVFNSKLWGGNIESAVFNNNGVPYLVDAYSESKGVSTMVFWMNHAIRAFLVFENHIVAQILRSPGFHNVVRRIHRRVQDHKHGRDPHEPLRPGEATELPGSESSGSFMKNFVEELGNQFRGTPTNPPPPPGPPRKPR